MDSSGAAIGEVQVKLRLEGGGPDLDTLSTGDGDYRFPEVPAGSFQLMFTAKGFAGETINGVLAVGQSLTLAPVTLSVAPVTTDVSVRANVTAIAEAQIQEQEQQRLIGVVPNFFVSYDPDAAPLNTRQKLQLTWKTFLDPSAFVINGAIAGVGQARNSHRGFGQGAQGYAKRYGASYADFATSVLLEKTVMPSIFRQDPRYFYKGTGTRKSRFLYAIDRTMVCRGDNKKDQFCCSSLVNRIGSGFLTNYYYPSADRDRTGTILQNAAISIGADAAANLFQEFIARKITRRKH